MEDPSCPSSAQILLISACKPETCQWLKVSLGLAPNHFVHIPPLRPTLRLLQGLECARGRCALFPQPGTLFHASTASLPSFLQVLMCPPLIFSGCLGESVCFPFLPSFLPSSPLLSHSFSHFLSPFLIFNYSSYHLPLSKHTVYFTPLAHFFLFFFI